MLKPLPYAQADRWIALFGGDINEPDRISGLSIADLQEYQRRSHSFDFIGWYRIGGDFNLTAPGQPQHIEGVEITPSLIDNAGVNAIIGRPFNDSDGANVAVISTRLLSRLGGGKAILGKAIELNGEAYTVTGVMPAWFQLPFVTVSSTDSHNDVWIPVKPPRNDEQRRGYSNYASYGRLRPGLTIAQARADVKRVAVEIARDDPQHHRAYTAVLLGLRDFVAKSIRPVLLLLFGAAALLFLITCANVAGLLVARAVGRARETAIRVALGGGQSQLARQFFAESLFVSIPAAVLGIVLSAGLVGLVVALAAEYIPRSEGIATNWAVVLFAIASACVAAILSSMAPLWQAIRTQPNEILSDGVRASAGARSRKLSQGLVVAEIALAFTLLSAGALLVSQLDNLNRISPGFDPDHLLTFQLNSFDARHLNGSGLAAYQDRLLRALDAVPGVESVALSNELPLAGCCFTTALFREDRTVRPDATHDVNLIIVSPGYFKTMRIPLRKGRLLNEDDTNETIVAVVIDEAAAKRYWPGRDPVGAYARVGAPDGSRLQIVGVVGNVRNDSLNEATRPELYLLNAVSPINPMKFVVRSDLPPAGLAGAVRRAVHNVDPAQPIYGVRTMEKIAADSLTFQRVNSVVVSFFALAALLLASLGIYGVMSYSVRQRTVEFGTRMALGAVGRDVLKLIVGSGLRMAAYGILIGGIAAAGATLLIVHFFHVHDIGPLPYLYSVVVVGALAAFASFFPGWRATLLSPMVAIRNESDSAWKSARRGVQRTFTLISGAEKTPAFDSELLTEFADASRRAESFSEALRIALAMLRDKIQANSAMLLKNGSDSEYRCTAAVPESLSSTCNFAPDGFLLNRLRFYDFPIAFSAGDFKTFVLWASEHKPEHVRESEMLQKSGVRLAIALRTKREVAGLLLLGAPTGRDQYSDADKQLVRACAAQFALMMENARLTDRIVEQEKIRRDAALAVEVQKRLLPEKPPDMTTSSLAAFSMAARSVGGDYYDFLNVGDRRIGIALADIAGKGVAAALIMAVVQASLRIIAAEGNISLPELAAKMNHFLHRSTGTSSYATFVYAQMDEDTRQLR